VDCDQARAPHAVGTASLFRSRVMAYAVLPSVRSRNTRATTSCGVDLGRPTTTPWSLRTASASRVRLRMKSRSSSAKTTGGQRQVVPSYATGGFRAPYATTTVAPARTTVDTASTRSAGRTIDSARPTSVIAMVPMATSSLRPLTWGLRLPGAPRTVARYAGIGVHGKDRDSRDGQPFGGEPESYDVAKGRSSRGKAAALLR
jgi:hypothetical protein